MENKNDNYLVQRVIGLHDQDAFSELHKRYFPKIFKFIYFRVSTREDADDIASQVFLDVWAYLTNQSVQQVQHFGGLIYRIARNRVISFYRIKGRIPLLVSLDALHDSEGHPFFELADTREFDPLLQELEQFSELDKSQVIDAVQQLPEGYREAVALRYFEGLNIPEIAEIMEKSQGNTRIIIHRGLKKLRPILAKLHAERKI